MLFEQSLDAIINNPFTSKEIYSKIVVTITYFFMLKLHIYFIYTEETETEILQKALQSVLHTFNLHWYFSK